MKLSCMTCPGDDIARWKKCFPGETRVSTMGTAECSDLRLLVMAVSHCREHRKQKPEQNGVGRGRKDRLCACRQTPCLLLSSALIDTQTVHVPGTGIQGAQAPGPHHEELSLRTVFRTSAKISIPILESALQLPNHGRTPKSPSQQGLHSCPNPSVYA